MTDSLSGLTDTEIDDQIFGFLRQHGVKILKAPITAAMAAFAAMEFGDSVSKAVVVGFCCLVLCGFNAWRRFLEPVVLALFIVAVAVWCNPAALSFLRQACIS